MDRLAELGAAWFCTGAHVIGNAELEMTTCVSPQSRFTVGLFTITIVALLCLFAVWRLVEARR